MSWCFKQIGQKDLGLPLRIFNAEFWLWKLTFWAEHFVHLSENFARVAVRLEVACGGTQFACTNSGACPWVPCRWTRHRIRRASGQWRGPQDLGFITHCKRWCRRWCRWPCHRAAAAGGGSWWTSVSFAPSPSRARGWCCARCGSLDPPRAASRRALDGARGRRRRYHTSLQLAAPRKAPSPWLGHSAALTVTHSLPGRRRWCAARTRTHHSVSCVLLARRPRTHY